MWSFLTCDVSQQNAAKDFPSSDVSMLTSCDDKCLKQIQHNFRKFDLKISVSLLLVQCWCFEPFFDVILGPSFKFIQVGWRALLRVWFRCEVRQTHLSRFYWRINSWKTLDLNYSLYFWLLRRHVRVYNHVLKCMQVRSQDFLCGGGGLKKNFWTFFVPKILNTEKEIEMFSEAD